MVFDHHLVYLWSPLGQTTGIMTEVGEVVLQVAQEGSGSDMHGRTEIGERVDHISCTAHHLALFPGSPIFSRSFLVWLKRSGSVETRLLTINVTRFSIKMATCSFLNV